MNEKILFFTEVPTAHLDELHPIIDGHFCIATECLKDPAYFNWYKNRPKDAFVMLDNGMFEEGKPLDVQTLFEVADAVKPNVVFAPDQVGDKKATLEMSGAFGNLCLERQSPWKIGLIPQGESIEAIVDCYYEMSYLALHQKLDLIGPIGISFLNDRVAVLDLILHRYERLAPHWHHFLGLYNLDEIANWPEGIISMDTIKPFKAAANYYPLEKCPRGLGKWNTSMVNTEEQMKLTYRNVAKMHQALTRRISL